MSLDRYAGTNFFTNDLGGNAMLYVNLIWIWGHPEGKEEGGIFPEGREEEGV